MLVAALSLLQFGKPVTPSFLGDFFGAGYFMFDFKGLLWSFVVPVVVAAALLSAAGRGVFVCGGAPFAWLCPTCFQPLRPPLRDAMLAALIGFLWYIFVQTVGLLFVCGAGFCLKLVPDWILDRSLHAHKRSKYGYGERKRSEDVSLFPRSCEAFSHPGWDRSCAAAGKLHQCWHLRSCTGFGYGSRAQGLLRVCGDRWCVPLLRPFDPERLGALAAVSWDFVAAALFAAATWPKALEGIIPSEGGHSVSVHGLVLRLLSSVTLQIVIVGDFLFAFVGLVPVTLRHEHKGSRIAFEEATWPRPHRLPRSSRPTGNSFTSLVPARCLLIHSSFVHSLVRFGGAVFLS